MEKNETKKQIANASATFKACLKIEGFAIEALENLHDIEELDGVCSVLRNLLSSCDTAKFNARSSFNNLTE